MKKQQQKLSEGQVMQRFLLKEMDYYVPDSGEYGDEMFDPDMGDPSRHDYMGSEEEGEYGMASEVMNSANDYDSFDSDLDEYDYEQDADEIADDDSFLGDIDQEYEDEEEFYDEFAASIPEVEMPYSENKKTERFGSTPKSIMVDAEFHYWGSWGRSKEERNYDPSIMPSEKLDIDDFIAVDIPQLSIKFYKNPSGFPIFSGEGIFKGDVDLPKDFKKNDLNNKEFIKNLITQRIKEILNSNMKKYVNGIGNAIIASMDVDKLSFQKGYSENKKKR